MVKPDFTRDFYADLGLQSGASEADIKKQFRLLALKYHPDRNPGREAEANSKFQTIQAAHEVLIDPEQKAKYDNARLKSAATRTYTGFGNTTTASGTRGNPWSSAGSEWAPPPKPPPAQSFERRKHPPTSAGAARYANFTTPNGTVPKANPDAEARKKTYQAWESMKQHSRPFQPSKPVPKEFTPQSGREESNSYRHPPPPKSSKPGYEEFRASASSSHSDRSPSRSQGANGPRRNGFMPGTPGPDEPQAASTAAYSTSRSSRPSSRRQYDVPEPHPRSAPFFEPSRQYQEKGGGIFEPRLSTPYATHGGEKTDPFESINRSKSTRIPSEKTNSANAGPFRPRESNERHRSASPPRSKPYRNLSPEPGIARADSDIHLGSPPKRTYSNANRTYQQRGHTPAYTRLTPPLDPNTSSDGDDSDSDKHQPSFGTRSRTFVKRRAAQPTTRSKKEPQGPRGGPESSTGENDERPRKPSLAEFRQWWSSAEEAKGHELNDPKPGDAPSSHGNDNHGNDPKDAPSMYAPPINFNILNHLAAKRASTLPTVMEEGSHPNPFPEKTLSQNSCKLAASSEVDASISKQWPKPVTQVTGELQPGSPSGASSLTPPGALTAFETTQRKVVEELLGIRTIFTESFCGSTNQPCINDLGWRNLPGMLPRPQDPAEAGSVKSPSNDLPKQHNSHSAECLECPSCGEMGSPCPKNRHDSLFYPASTDAIKFTIFFKNKDYTRADKTYESSFTFNVEDDTFKSTRPPPSPFASSAENINPKFVSEEWHGKFEAGDLAANDRAGVNGRSRTRSGSRTRTRSPMKGQPMNRSRGSARPPVSSIDPEILQQTTDSDQPIPSSGGTKFTAEEWTRTFKPQNFAPPLYPSSSTTGRPPLRASRRSKTGSSTPKPPNATKAPGTAAMTSEDESSDQPLEMGKRSTQPTTTPRENPNLPPEGTDSPNAMDIDTPSEQPSDPARAAPENAFLSSSNKAANEARNVPVEPSRPEWRAGDTSGPDMPAPTRPEPHLRSEGPGTNRRQTTASVDEEDFKTNLDDLKNVEPLRHPATGLHSFSELTANLPFPSQAASTYTISRNFASGELDLPHPPRAPMIPPVANVTHISMSSWDSYLVAFKAYMAEWDIFNTKMIVHFVARKNQVDGMKPGWLEAFGDSDLDKYKEGLVEDFKVRQWWDVACEKHQDAMEKFQFFKGCMREGVPGPRDTSTMN